MAQAGGDGWSCYRRLFHRINLDTWLTLAETESISESDLHRKLNSNWSAVGAVSGLVSGFTYIASSTGDIEFSQSGYFGDQRIHIFGLLSMLSFIASLTATLFCTLLFGMMNILGEENTNWFVTKNWWVIDAPLNSLVIATIFMLASALVSIGGIVDT